MSCVRTSCQARRVHTRLPTEGGIVAQLELSLADAACSPRYEYAWSQVRIRLVRIHCKSRQGQEALPVFPAFVSSIAPRPAPHFLPQIHAECHSRSASTFLRVFACTLFLEWGRWPVGAYPSPAVQSTRWLSLELFPAFYCSPCCSSTPGCGSASSWTRCRAFPASRTATDQPTHTAPASPGHP